MNPDSLLGGFIADCYTGIPPHFFLKLISRICRYKLHNHLCMFYVCWQVILNHRMVLLMVPHLQWVFMMPM